MDNLKRKLFIKQELRKLLLHSLIRNEKFPLAYRYFMSYQLVKQPR
jgi:hypothetical protein